MMGYVLESRGYIAAAYITALTIDFFTLAFASWLRDVIMKQPIDVLQRPESPSGDGVL